MMLHDYELTVGLEVHIQLDTLTKAFSPEGYRFGQAANTAVSPLTMALPGTLPRLNEKVLQYAIRLALACQCRIQDWLCFDRKHYFYADLPKGYQITQHHYPLGSGGQLMIQNKEGNIEAIALKGIHIEEDAGKSLHDKYPEQSAIDLNRAGVPLLEIVSHPLIKSSDQAYRFLWALRRLVRYLKISDGNMEEGSLRCDANVSVKHKMQEHLGKRCEIKNLNSFTQVAQAIDYEFQRQRELLLSGQSIEQETRSLDVKTAKTFTLRKKEDLHDYRYMPEPDLPPMPISKDYINTISRQMPLLPHQYYQKYTQSLKLSAYDAALLIDDYQTCLYFEALIAQGASPKTAANWLLGAVRAFLKNEHLNMDQYAVEPSVLAEVLAMVEAGEMAQNIAQQKLLPALHHRPDMPPKPLAKELKLLISVNENTLKNLLKKLIENNSDKAEQYRQGKTGLLGWFVGQVMQQTKGQANPRQVKDYAKALLETDR